MSVDTTQAIPSGFDVYPPVVPSGGGGTTPTVTAVATEALLAGQFVAIYDNAGTPSCRVARSSSGQGYQADGFVQSAFAMGATATIYLPGQVNTAGGSGLIGGDVFLGTNGYATNTAPTTAGYISQQIGVAESATAVAFEPQPDILIASASAIAYGGVSQSIALTSSGNLTIPLGVTGGRLTMVGGGGGGSTQAAAIGGGGGGAGEKVTDFPVNVTGGASYAVTIGAAGAGAASGGGSAAGGNGGDTSIVIGGLTFTVRGGKGGSSGGGGGAGGGIGGAVAAVAAGALGSAETTCHFGGSSGGASGGAANPGFAGGASGGFNSGAAGGAGASSQGGGGGGAATEWGLGGAGGAGGVAGTNAASDAYGAGGGGAGGLTGGTTAGGDGAPGYLLFEFVA